MKRVLAIFCSAVLLAYASGATADPVSDREMASRYLRAAQAGDDEAQFYIASLYSAGVGVQRSDEEAFRWFSRAASKGHSHAMLIVAGLYAVGRGVEKNNIEAYKWAYIVSGASRVDEFRNGSRQLMEVLDTRMSPEEVNLAKTEASRWRAAPTTQPAQAAAPADYTRAQPLAPAPPPPPAAALTTATPAPPPPSNPLPPARASNDDSSSPIDALSKNVKKGDIDSFLKEVPALRKKFGF
jgi:hypothetical protein